MKIAVIPARGGSKRIPRKNIRLFAGRPIIAYSIEAALAAGCFDKVVVSTDDPEIAETAQAEGAEVPFVRPADLSGDQVVVATAVRHTIEWFEGQGEAVAEACLIYATAPFVAADDLAKAGDMLAADPDAEFVMSVTSYAYPIQRAVRLTPGNRVEMIAPEHRLTRSQDLEEAYHDAAQFCFGRASAYLADEPLFGPKTAAYVVPRYRVQDIDTEEDWHRAEMLFKVRQAD